MKEKTIERMLADTEPISLEIMQKAKEHWNRIAKPLYSLGKLETIISRMAAIQGNCSQVLAKKVALVIMCADHGVVAEGVTQTGYEITKVVTDNFVSGKTSAAIMAQEASVDLFPVDIGIDCASYPERELKKAVVLDRKIARGSGNIAREAAMSEQQCRQALLTGISLAGQLKDMGYHMIATGEMGIGNTTPSSALASFFLKQSPEKMTGKGAGLSKEGIERKKKVVEAALKRYNCQQITGSAIEVLANLGGYDIVGMAGLFLGGYIHKIPVLIDGFISAVSALCAAQICPEAKSCMFATHVSKEPAGEMVLKALGLEAVVTADMCLGEGTGALTAVPMIRMAAEVYNRMEVFGEIAIDQYEDYSDE